MLPLMLMPAAEAGVPAADVEPSVRASAPLMVPVIVKG